MLKIPDCKNDPQNKHVGFSPKSVTLYTLCIGRPLPFSLVYHMVATLLSILATFAKMADKNAERTFIMIKPDGVQRGLVGEIMKRFEARGYKLVACKMCMVRDYRKRRHCEYYFNF